CFGHSCVGVCINDRDIQNWIRVAKRKKRVRNRAATISTEKCWRKGNAAKGDSSSNEEKQGKDSYIISERKNKKNEKYVLHSIDAHHFCTIPGAQAATES